MELLEMRNMQGSLHLICFSTRFQSFRMTKLRVEAGLKLFDTVTYNDGLS